mmetsp:Transcript_32479/g.77587  ORF Transcript_32479/g.77587 Transcript_32479/m.77587 type:complete len:269 (+) Transcript_32479:152-958(+)
MYARPPHRLFVPALVVLAALTHIDAFAAPRVDTSVGRATPPLSGNPIQSKSTELGASVSGIDELPLVYQSAAFLGIYGLLGVLSAQCVKFIDSASKELVGLEGWRNSFIDTSIPLVLGILYSSAGLGHFLSKEAFCDIYPAIGSWGLWYVPGSPEFHVAWTGLVEFLGGVGLVASGARSILGRDEDDDESLPLRLVQPISAAALLLLTMAVTPANIYMYTHGAVMGPDMPPLDLSFHYIRFAVQVLLLSTLWILVKDSFFYVWGDELD